MWLNCCNLKAKFSWMRSCFLWIKKESSFLRWNLLLVKMLWRFVQMTFRRFCCSVAQLCLTFDPMDCNTPGFPVLHHLLDLTQTHVHWVNDAIQKSHPLSSPSLHLQSFPASRFFPVSWLFTSGGQSIGASTLP